jgi:hypothetical protein
VTIEVLITVDPQLQDSLLDRQISLTSEAYKAFEKVLAPEELAPIHLGCEATLDGKIEKPTEESMIRQAMTRIGQVNTGQPWWPDLYSFAPGATSSLEVSISGLASTFFFDANGKLLHLNQDY